MATADESAFRRSDLDPITQRTLDAFRRRRGFLLVMRAIGVGMLVFISFALLLATLDYLVYFDDAVRWALSLVIYVATALSMWWSGLSALRKRDELEIAKHVESTAPNLRENLVSAVELADPEASNGSPYFRKLLQGRVARRMAKVNVRQLLPLRLVRRWVLSGLSVVAFCVAMMFIPSAQFGRRFARAALPGIAIERASTTKVQIIEPSPASGYVAERDAVGVVVAVYGAEADDVMLHWRSADGTSGESVMTPRVSAAEFQPGGPDESDATVSQKESGTIAESGGRFAANLSVGSLPIQYRITAGDAITLWHELTPLPRPRVIRYEKLYRLPAYAKLDDRTADEEHGDLKALQGTTAEVTVTFDQPVENPVVRFGVRGSRTGMEPVDESGTKFLARVSIKTSGQYQVDATSVQSGLNNPFSPTNMITPVLDTPPVVRWSEETKPAQMVSSLDVIDLAAFAADDLPLERVIQEVQVNEDEVRSYALDIPTPDRKLDLAWSWDLMHRLGEKSDTKQLSAGDLIRTRLVAIDRRGSRTESKQIEFLIAGDGFDADRYQFLEPFSEQVRRVMKWAEQSEQLAKTLKEIGKSREFESLAGLEEKWTTLQKESVDLIKGHAQRLTATQNPASASMTELVGRAILDVESRLDSQLKRMRWLAGKDEESWAKQRERYCAEVGKEADQAAYQCERLAEFAQARFSLALSASIYSDVSTLRENVTRLVDRMPEQRVPRYVTLIAGQIAEIDRLIEQYEPLLSQQAIQHLSGEHWMRWAQRWTIQLERLLEDQAKRDQVHAVLSSLRDELQQKPQHAINSGTHNTALRWGRDIRKEMGYLSDLTRRLNDAGRNWEQAIKAAQNERDAKQAVARQLDEQWGEFRWLTELNRLVVRAAGQEKLNRAKSQVDLQYAADQNLFLRAIKNVTADGYKAYREESAAKVFDAIGRAIAFLQGYSDVNAARNDWLAIREGERQDDGSPLRKIYHPIWFKLQDTRVELGVRYLRQTDLDWQQNLQPIDETRYNDDHKVAYERLDSRQWRMDPFLSAAPALESLAKDVHLGLEGLAEKQEEARDVLRRYVLKLSEQARDAAESAKEAEQETDERPDASEESAEEVEPKQQEAVDKATETIGALIDQANTSDIINDEQREVARDADAAAELIAEAVKDTKDAIKQVEQATEQQQRDEALEAVEEKLDSLAQRLEQTAEHFEKVENGEDVSESRSQLREAEQELQSGDLLEDRYQRADEMADTAKQDPRELLRELEEELRRNEPMQDALSDISAETVENVAKNLEQASKEEDTLQRQLESDDQAFAEQKRQKQSMLDEFIERARTLRNQTLQTTSQAASWANDPEAREQIEQARQELNEAIDDAQQVRNGSPTMEEIRSAARDLGKELQEASAAVEDASKQLAENVEKDLHGDARKRQAAATSMKQYENRLRNEELRSLDRQRKKWSSTEREAGRRVRTAEQNERRAEDAIKREQDKLKKNPDDESPQREIAKQEDRRAEAERTAQQARKTTELAKDRRKQADQRANEMNRRKSTPLDKPNPAAQLGEKLAKEAAQRMDRLSDEINQFNEDAQIDSELRARSESAESLADRQESVQENVREAVEDLARASRHEERLENSPMAEKLAEASEQTESGAGQAADQAGNELQQAMTESGNANQAGQALNNASEELAAQAEAVSSLLESAQAQTSDASPSTDQTGEQPAGEPSQSASADATQSPSQPSSQSPSAQQPGSQQPGTSQQPSSGQPTSGQPTSGQPTSGQPTSGQPSAQQMAQTLDELDRSLAAQASADQSSQQPGETQPGQPGQPGGQPDASQQPNSSQQPGGEPSDQGQLGSGQPPQNAIDASPTLAEMLEAQMQQAARERMKSLQEAQGMQQQGQQSPSDSTSPNPVSESGEGEAPGGPDDIELLRGALIDGDWGDLRRQGVDDAAQGRSIQIPPGYSREIKAYFKALSKRAAETKDE